MAFKKRGAPPKSDSKRMQSRRELSRETVKLACALALAQLREQEVARPSGWIVR